MLRSLVLLYMKRRHVVQTVVSYILLMETGSKLLCEDGTNLAFDITA